MPDTDLLIVGGVILLALFIDQVCAVVRYLRLRRERRESAKRYNRLMSELRARKRREDGDA